jgi:hypothetical protein
MRIELKSFPACEGSYGDTGDVSMQSGEGKKAVAGNLRHGSPLTDRAGQRIMMFRLIG